ncbi:S8 family serine peptidase [Gardnerella sp. KA00243]|uniref:S8 family serine peptidase n=1 Tax=Gardnerella sp. KA00243 TaxID=2749072 RepID=UPI003BA8E8EC
MKFKRTSYLTRLAALGVAAATLMVPLGQVPAAFAKNDNETKKDGNALVSKMLDSSLKANSEIKSIEDLRHVNPTLAKAFEDYSKKDQFNKNSNAQVTVVVTLKNYRSQLTDADEKANIHEQNVLINRVKSKYNMTVRRQVGYLMSAFEATLPEKHVQDLKREPGVVSVAKERLYHPMENYARDLQGVQTVFKKHHLDGTGMLVSIIDTGIDPNHQDMKLDDSAKKNLRLKPTGKGNTTDKVPAGYNYADENTNFTDANGEQHGMHVAGIVAANGDENGAPASENHRVDGIAPNAQLLAMKVFSNVPGSHGARDVDIVAAIEDSVKLGADVINMSLGSDNGFGGTSSATSVALKKAREAGVLPVISAGNSGLNFSESGGIDDSLGKWDDATIGSPSSYPSAFSVASVENSNITQQSANWVGKDGKSHTLPYSYSIGSLTDALSQHELVDAKKATKADVKDLDLTGKYALVERGGISFTEKFNNAISKGAKGVIVYNHDKDSSLFIGMGGLEKIKNCFGASIPRSYALEIKAALDKGEKVKIAFTEQFVTIANPDDGKPSSFTSWGPTPEFDFKPQIAGIGGNVWSTQNGNKYTSMSGTSMAAPNVSGLSALVMESYKNRFPELNKSEMATRVSQALMNTASIIGHKDSANSKKIPYAPRQIGAGLAQVDKAVATDVIATVNGNSYVALKNVNSNREFTVTLHNYGKTPVKFAVPDQEVVNESNEANKDTVTSISDTETLQSKTRTVTVKPGKTADVKFTLSPNSSKGNHYIEGWVRFESLTDSQPDVSVPYLGFVGDWNDEPIMVKPGESYSAKHSDLTTSLLSVAGFMGKLPVNNETKPYVLGEFSPANQDGWMDYVVPSMAIFRGASDIKYSVLDSHNKTKIVLGTEHNVHRSTIANAGTTDGLAGNFDGSVWNPKTSRFDILPDGWYTYRIQARLGDKFDWQTYDMKVAIDNHGPKVTVSDRDDKGNVKIVISDELSPDPGVPTIHLPGVKDALNYGDEDTQCPLNEATRTRVCKSIHIGNEAQYIDVLVRDNAMNPTEVKKVFDTYVPNGSGKPEKNKKFIIPNEQKLTSHQIKANQLEESKTNPDINGKFYLEGYLTKDVASIKAYVTPKDGKKQEVKLAKKRKGENTFYAFVPLKNGKNTVMLKAFNSNGDRIGNKKLELTFNAQTPKITVNGLDDKGNLPVGADGKVTVAGKVTDTPGDTVKLKLTYQKAADNTTPANAVAGSVNNHASGSASGSTTKAVFGANTTSATSIDANVKQADAAAASKETEEVVTVGKDGSFKTVITPAAKAVMVTLVATDSAENTTTIGLALAGRSTPTPKPAAATKDFVLTNAGSMGSYAWLIHKKNYGPDVIGSDYFVAQGDVSSKVTSVVFTPASRFDATTKNLVTPNPLRAEIKNGKFSVKLPMHPGINDFRLQVNTKADDEDADEDDETNVIDTPAAFYFDITPPTAHFDTPKLYGHTLFTNRDTVTFSGNVSDDAFGQSLRINNDSVGDFYTLDTNGKETTRRQFSTDIPVDNGDKLLLHLSDQVESHLLSVIPVVLDETDPTVEAGLVEGEEIDDGHEITVKATDDNLKSLRVMVDGRPVAYTENYLPTTAVENTLVDVSKVNDNPTPDKPGSTTLTLKIPTNKLTDGSHTITIEATDFAGNTASATSDNAKGATAYTFKVKHGVKPGEDPSKPGEDPSKPGQDPKKPGEDPKKPGEDPAKPKNPGTKDESTQTDSAPIPPASTEKISKTIAGLETKNVTAGKEVKIYVSGQPKALKEAKADARMYAFIYSDPKDLKGEDGHEYVTVRTGENGKYYFKVLIPSGYSGKHTILLMDANGNQIASGEVSVSSSASSDSGSQTDSDNQNNKNNQNQSGSGNTGNAGNTGNSEGGSSGHGKDSGNNGGSTSGSASGDTNNDSRGGNHGGSHSSNHGGSHSSNHGGNHGGKSFTTGGNSSNNSESSSKDDADSTNAGASAASGDAAANGNASSANGNASAANANAAAKQKAAAKSAAKKMTSDLAMTGSSVIGMVVTFMVLLASGAVTFKTRSRHVRARK